MRMIVHQDGGDNPHTQISAQIKMGRGSTGIIGQKLFHRLLINQYHNFPKYGKIVSIIYKFIQLARFHCAVKWVREPALVFPWKLQSSVLHFLGYLIVFLIEWCRSRHQFSYFIGKVSKPRLAHLHTLVSIAHYCTHLMREIIDCLDRIINQWYVYSFILRQMVS